MHITEWLMLAGPALVLAGAGVAAVARLTRMTVVLEELGKDIRLLVGRVDNHDLRLGELEHNTRGRHRYR
jgi:hypothetical protein